MEPIRCSPPPLQRLPKALFTRIFDYLTISELPLLCRLTNAFSELLLKKKEGDSPSSLPLVASISGRKQLTFREFEILHCMIQAVYKEMSAFDTPLLQEICSKIHHLDCSHVDTKTTTVFRLCLYDEKYMPRTELYYRPKARSTLERDYVYCDLKSIQKLNRLINLQSLTLKGCSQAESVVTHYMHRFSNEALRNIQFAMHQHLQAIENASMPIMHGWTIIQVGSKLKVAPLVGSIDISNYVSNQRIESTVRHTTR